MQNFKAVLDLIQTHPVLSALAGLAAVVFGPPVSQFLNRTAKAYWRPKTNRLRKKIAERVAPKDAGAEEPEEVVRLHEQR